MTVSVNSGKNWLRRHLHRSSLYWELRAIEREGITQAYKRIRYQRAILSSPPVRTADRGRCEVRVLTYHGDWLNAMWAIKSFYHWAKVDLPLHIHDGGLFKGQVKTLRVHFPQAIFHLEEDTTQRIEADLASRGYDRSRMYRRKNRHMYKLFDFYLGNEAEKVIVIDSDVVFFACPETLLDSGRDASGPNIYNRDFQYAYAASSERMAEIAGRPVDPFLNSGLGCVSPRSIDFELVESCLQLPEFFETYGVVEQSMHALCSAHAGFDLLPTSYVVSTEAGLPDGAVAKHYPSAPRPYLYQEGMAKLIDSGFLKAVVATAKSEAIIA